MALRDTEQRRFAAILTTLSTPTPFDTDLTQMEMKRKQRWSGKDKTIEHLLDGFFIVNEDFHFEQNYSLLWYFSDASLCD